ncbi:hypothetical protein [Beggiatoa leptomitoformis]|uniref:Uncharacterized protein n=2 Tax=Beggiatoa leptomitoformis TaxID=288004 RepID=A0A2N9YG76_9GAMM|nr:hypothetical protein [Beggiatoa leptomitoformis]ALG68212.1 hypothetical protein AL038_11440 [Beggiatoa leptomitoformis]AUI69483.1 hypothetical protein BLE401_12830 [Beggiatoa leptomitoformis]
MQPKFDKAYFVKMMRFPNEWVTWGMYPNELFKIQLIDYEPGSESASEHYRYGAFQWWLHQKLTLDTIRKYVDLTHLDPDPLMGESARRDLEKR